MVRGVLSSENGDVKQKGLRLSGVLCIADCTLH